jgi:hypothetical protein
MSSGELLRPDLARYGGVDSGRWPDLQMEGVDWVRSREDWVRFRCDLGKCRLELWREATAGDMARGGGRSCGARWRPELWREAAGKQRLGGRPAKGEGQAACVGVGRVFIGQRNRTMKKISMKHFLD